MTLLFFAGKGDKLRCVPPNQIDTTDKQVALVYFQPSKPRLLVSANFVYESVVNDGTKRFLGASDHSGPPMFLPMKPNVTEFELTFQKLGETNPTKLTKDTLAIVQIK